MIDNITLVLVHGALVVLMLRLLRTSDPEEAPPPRARPAPRFRPPGVGG